MLVLNVEDDFEDFDILCEILSAINPSIQCINARNGYDAMELLENTPDPPDFILLDVNMPTMDGKSCLKFLKKDERLKSIPVIIYSTGAIEKDVALCLELGAVAYIQKSSTINEGVERLSPFLKKE